MEKRVIVLVDYVVVIDVTKCVDCRACVIQCKDEYALNDYPPYSVAMPFAGHKWIRVEGVERGSFPKVRFSSIPIMCMHCDDPPCERAATGGSVYKRSDGVVIIDPVRSVGQRQLISSCPYGAIYYNVEKDVPQKCTLCIHRLEEGKEPRCVMACPSKAIQIGDSSLKRIVKEKNAATLHPEYHTMPLVYYIGLPKKFIAGALVDHATGDCVQDADVVLVDLATLNTVTTKSDNYGDFWLDNLDAGKSYKLTVSKQGLVTWAEEVFLNDDKNLGDIELFAAGLETSRTGK